MAVGVLDGIKYGFKLIGYILAVLIIALIFGIPGGLVVEGSESISGALGGIILIIIAALIFMAGMLGLQYKIYADAVETGIREEKKGAGAGGISTTRRKSTSDEGKGNFCPECGAEASEDAEYCPNCGAEL